MRKTAFISGENRLVYVNNKPEVVDNEKNIDFRTLRALMFVLLVTCAGVSAYRSCEKSGPAPETENDKIALSDTPPTPDKPLMSASEAGLVFRKKSMTEVNFRAPQNDNNAPRLEALGINLKPLNGLRTNELFPNGEGAEKYEDFEKRVIEVLQPDSVVNIADPQQRHAMQVLSASAILSASAVGVFQILLQYHGDALPGWDSPEKKNWKNVDWAGNLRVIHRYMNDPDYQFTAAIALVGALQKQYNGHIRLMAAVYSNNDGKTTRSKAWIKDIYSKNKSYMGKVQKIFNEETGRNKVKNTPEDLKAFLRGIAYAETGTQRSKGYCPEGAKCD